MQSFFFAPFGGGCFFSGFCGPGLSFGFFGDPFAFVSGYGGYGFGPGCDPMWGCDGFGYGGGYGGYGDMNSGDMQGQADQSGGGSDVYPEVWQSPPDNSQTGGAPENNASSGYNGTQGAGQDNGSAESPATVLYLKDGSSYAVSSYWMEGGKLCYVTTYGGENSIDPSQLDLQRTVDENAADGVSFVLRPAPDGQPADQNPQAAPPDPGANGSPAPQAAPQAAPERPSPVKPSGAAPAPAPPRS